VDVDRGAGGADGVRGGDAGVQVRDERVGLVAQPVGGVLRHLRHRVEEGLRLVHVVDLEGEGLALVDDEVRARGLDVLVVEGVARGVVEDRRVADGRDVHRLAVRGDLALVVAVDELRLGVDERVAEGYEELRAPDLRLEVVDRQRRLLVAYRPPPR
jgi:hypothetical protein